MRPDATTSTDNRGPIDHLVIVGNGMAAHRLVATLCDKPRAPRRITVIGEETSDAYNRILLSPWLAGEMQRDALHLPEHAATTQTGTRIETRLGERVTAIDRKARRVTTDRGASLDYDRLVLATGSRSAMPPVPGMTLDGVHGFRDLGDAEALARAARHGGRAVVIGGGLLGLEAAEGLRKRGMRVRVIQRSSRLMNRQLDATAAGLLRDELEARGLEVITEGHLSELEDNGQGRVRAVILDDGTRLAADHVVIATGIAPNVEPGRAAGLDCDRAIRVDEWLTTSDAAIHALGECCQFGSSTFGLVEPIWQQVEVLAARLAGEAGPGYRDRPTATKLKISGVSLYAFGPIEATPEHDVLTYHDPEQGEYRRLLLRDGRIEGAVLYGDTAMGPWLFDRSRDGMRFGSARRALLLGQVDTETLLDDQASAPQATDTFDQEAA
ncbi:NAD(P)/FAD-dependent oxidoreductase [Halomonas elongata]|uniref:FAD-dependent oxidoreductase n=1 Tax=Halomonas elongata (strain ATCC 33173 / DSM 2581 / NBRC 15536 / NCIMB 2198 / 1H9) TaxID=768066 RepID=E1V5G3_HALED|nr:FAD-dependent oxidoreductase [Halomonas elongata]WBF16858.1 FAD-dependent oxidoreductase [Halomonas elongata]WPU45689.1 FAD-dependent oxidoreductase [Halomonas elongata DSM 2581]CBV43118.1 nitrite reductase electron transfer subunit [Halomonas elongata DSM 2581]